MDVIFYADEKYTGSIDYKPKLQKDCNGYYLFGTYSIYVGQPQEGRLFKFLKESCDLKKFESHVYKAGFKYTSSLHLTNHIEVEIPALNFHHDVQLIANMGKEFGDFGSVEPGGDVLGMLITTRIYITF